MAIGSAVAVPVGTPPRNGAGGVACWVAGRADGAASWAAARAPDGAISTAADRSMALANNFSLVWIMTVIPGVAARG
jgi:hypothetical protein